MTGLKPARGVVDGRVVDAEIRDSVLAGRHALGDLPRPPVAGFVATSVVLLGGWVASRFVGGDAALALGRICMVALAIVLVLTGLVAVAYRVASAREVPRTWRGQIIGARALDKRLGTPSGPVREAVVQLQGQVDVLLRDQSVLDGWLPGVNPATLAGAEWAIVQDLLAMTEPDIETTTATAADGSPTEVAVWVLGTDLGPRVLAVAALSDLAVTITEQIAVLRRTPGGDAILSEARHRLTALGSVPETVLEMQSAARTACELLGAHVPRSAGS